MHSPLSFFSFITSFCHWMTSEVRISSGFLFPKYGRILVSIICFFVRNVLRFILGSKIRQINIHKALKAHTDTLILFQLEVPLPFKVFAFLCKAPLGLLLPFSGQSLIISPHLPHSGLFVLDNRHLSHLLVCGQS